MKIIFIIPGQKRVAVFLDPDQSLSLNEAARSIQPLLFEASGYEFYSPVLHGFLNPDTDWRKQNVAGGDEIILIPSCL